jgi:hypothetical protein
MIDIVVFHVSSLISIKAQSVEEFEEKEVW